MKEDTGTEYELWTTLEGEHPFKEQVNAITAPEGSYWKCAMRTTTSDGTQRVFFLAYWTPSGKQGEKEAHSYWVTDAGNRVDDATETELNHYFETINVTDGSYASMNSQWGYWEIND